MKKIVISGGYGFIGSNLIKHFLKKKLKKVLGGGVSLINMVYKNKSIFCIYCFFSFKLLVVPIAFRWEK